MLKRALAVVLFAGLCLVLQSAVARADDPARGPIKPRILEHLDNPPAVNTVQPVPGAPPTPAVVYGHTKSIQVNVGPGGSNILGDAANEPTIAAQLLASFLKSHEQSIAKALGAGDLATARSLVNGGSNGLDRFKDAYNIGKSLIPDSVSA